MKTSNLAYITPAYDNLPATISIKHGDEITSCTMDLNTMTKLLIQLAAEIKHASRSISR